MYQWAEIVKMARGRGKDAPNSRQAWARVKAETETALSKVGFRDVYALRPGMIQPMRGVKSGLRSLRWFYALTAPVYPFLQKTLGRWVT